MYLLAGLLFSSIGGVFLIVGKRTYSTPYLVCGAVLLIASYLIENALVLMLVGSVVCAIPYGISRGWI